MINMTLMDVKQIEIPNKVLLSTFYFLRKNGERKLESHAIWVGKENLSTFKVLDVWFPKQSNDFISYEVLDEEVHRINVRLNKLGLTAIAQVHTHPCSAYHSTTDDNWPILVLPGSFSVVIPDYGFIEEENLDEWAVYRYNGTEWFHISNAGGEALFQII